ncbi:NUDIX hydrolase [Ruminococcus sp. 5_1_39BFAA]|uniref:NUDIX hydrolase n=1 Tax=Ruminococcus sp. 5_1_39BFAA TaxID=457412 RepID=UPI0035645844
MNRWKTIKSDTLLNNHWITVHKDAVELPDKKTIDDYYTITLNDAVSVVAMDESGNVILVKEYRYCCGCDSIEIPAGTFEKGETDPLIVAKRELLEETGYESEGWTYLGSTSESTAKLTNRMHIFFAHHCHKISNQNLDETEDIEVLIISLEKAVEMVMQGEIICNSSAHGILRVARMLGK